jgi:hypothetical protein
LRPILQRAWQRRCSVLPAVHRWLYNGGLIIVGTLDAPGRAPADRWRAPLRQALFGESFRSNHRCSRRSPRAPLQGLYSAVFQQGGGRLPPYQRRAPLRPARPVSADRLSRRAPAVPRRLYYGYEEEPVDHRGTPAARRQTLLRGDVGLVELHLQQLVLPPFSGGLHCGVPPASGTKKPWKVCYPR